MSDNKEFRLVVTDRQSGEQLVADTDTMLVAYLEDVPQELEDTNVMIFRLELFEMELDDLRALREALDGLIKEFT